MKFRANKGIILIWSEVVEVIKIALCDDTDIFLEEFKNLIQEYIINHSLDAEVYSYKNGESFLKGFEKDPYFFDIIFLDIDMPFIDGIQVAEQIRIYNKNLILIFLTSVDNRVYETFQFNTFRFIRKSYILTELDECLGKAIHLLECERKLYTFKTKEGTVKLSTQDILYFICINRHIEIHTLHHCYIIRIKRFQDIIDQFQSKNFICIHRSCMVNVKYIKEINKLWIVLDNNQKLSISRYKYDEVFQAFTNYAR